MDWLAGIGFLPLDVAVVQVLPFHRDIRHLRLLAYANNSITFAAISAVGTSS